MNEKKFNTIRLSKTHRYERPEKTITDSLQESGEFKKKLVGYSEVKDIDNVAISTHVRYFIFSNIEKKWLFRTGGLLTKKHHKYVVLSNGTNSWSVQREIKNTGNDDIYLTKFFKIKSKNDKDMETISKQQKEIDELKKDNQQLSEKLQLFLEKFSHLANK